MAIIRAGAVEVSEPSLTRDISSGGVSFTSSKELDVGGSIEYVITLNSEPTRVLSLHCVGKVLRFEKVPGDSSDRFAVAATLERYEFVRQ